MYEIRSVISWKGQTVRRKKVIHGAIPQRMKRGGQYLLWIALLAEVCEEGIGDECGEDLRANPLDDRVLESVVETRGKSYQGEKHYDDETISRLRT
jgi:hypothetical protein